MGHDFLTFPKGSEMDFLRSAEIIAGVVWRVLASQLELLQRSFVQP